MVGQDVGGGDASGRRRDKDRRLASLMTAAQDGDGSAYAALLDEVARLLRRHVGARNRALQAADVEDVVQDILMSLHLARATYDPERAFLPWLMAIARNRMADAARRHARRSANEMLVDELPETFSGERTNKAADELVDSMALRDAIKSLPPGQREAIEMVKLRQMSLAEASEASGTTVAALKISVHRAIKRLREVLKSEG